MHWFISSHYLGNTMSLVSCSESTLHASGLFCPRAVSVNASLCSFNTVAANCRNENETYESLESMSWVSVMNSDQVSSHYLRNISVGFEASPHHRERNSQSTWQLHFHKDRQEADNFSQTFSYLAEVHVLLGHKDQQVQLSCCDRGP